MQSIIALKATLTMGTTEEDPIFARVQNSILREERLNYILRESTLSISR